MTAISVSYSAIANAAIDPDSPIDQALMTALRDNTTFVYEWLGAGFAAGAVQDHSHDGVDSALLELGPNALRNGSFESNETGWTFTDYTAGSHAQETANDMHGASSMSFTSTVLANGGGDAVSNAFIACSEDDALPWEAHIKASVANVSARLEIIWYDAAQAQISAANLADLTNTPTAATRYSGAVSAVANARYFKIRATGGVPGAGSATGTIYFDGLRVSDFPLADDSVTQAVIAAAAVGQGELKTTTGQVSQSSTPAGLTLPGGSYGFYPRSRVDGGGGGNGIVYISNGATGGTTSTSFTTHVTVGNTQPAGTTYVEQRYIQASPPYDLGDGDIALFMFAALNSPGGVIATYVAEDPPWANNGPTDIRADFYRGRRGYQRRRAINADIAKLLDPLRRDAHLAELAAAPMAVVEITQALKQADMPLIPHPFVDAASTPDIAQIALIEPVGALAEQVCRLLRGGENASEIVHRYLQIDNAALDGMNAPPGVMPVRARWKNSSR